MITAIVSALIGAAVSGAAVHYWHKTHPLKIGPSPNTGSGGQPGGPGQGH